MASKPYGYVRFRAVGVVETGNSWSIGLAVDPNAALTNGDMQAWLDGIAPDVAASYGSETDKWGLVAATGTTLTHLEAYGYNAGASSASYQARHDYGTPIPGAASRSIPSMTAMCVTLLTALPGRKNHGRVYVPADGALLPGHRFAQSDVQGVTRGIVSLIDHINGSTFRGEPVRVGVATQASFQDITSCRTDDNPDTQRPRAGRATYSYTDPV